MPSEFQEHNWINQQAGADLSNCAADSDSQAKAILSTSNKQIIKDLETAAKLNDAKPDQIYTVKSMSAVARTISGGQPSQSSLTITWLAQATGFAKGFVTCSNPNDESMLKAALKNRTELQLLPHRKAVLQEIGDCLVKSCPQKDEELFLIKDSSTLDSNTLKKFCEETSTLHIVRFPRGTTKLLHPLHQLQTPRHEVRKQRQQKKEARAHSEYSQILDQLDTLLARSAALSRENIKRAFDRILRDRKALCWQDKSPWW